MIKNSLIIAICTLAFSTSSLHAFFDSASKDAAINIPKLLQEYVDDCGAVGAAVGLINKGKVNFYCYGKKSIHSEDPISEDSIFEIGSITKVFTTLALMDMVTQGKIQLDDPIEMYLPGIKIPEMNGKKITIRHLAVHHSGLHRLPDNFNPQNPSNPYVDYTVENLYDYLENCTLQNAPGEQFEYSNVGMGLLGHLLSKISHQSYEELIQSTICEKLDMPHTTITIPPEMNAQLAKGHDLSQEVDYWDIPVLAGAVSFRSNIKDMTNFLAANMGLLNSPLTQLLQQCHQIQYQPVPVLSIGLGWMRSYSHDAVIIWHNGGTGGFRSYLGFNPKTQKGIVILSNSTEDWVDEFAACLLDPWHEKPIIDKSLADDHDYLNQFTGYYEALMTHDHSTLDLEITLCNKQLGTEFSDGEVGMLYPEEHGVFGVKGFPEDKVYFTFNPLGKIIKVQALNPNGAIIWDAAPKSLSSTTLQGDS